MLNCPDTEEEECREIKFFFILIPPRESNYSFTLTDFDVLINWFAKEPD
jgi:hypothetical protein